mmetsp:Transcript_2367/g.7840  ORF Transcript_2367/g.7840 Transcript_2367/m.7840 type:complete len:277 (+) Transcript_2367:10214-11044(+)
MGPRHRTRQAAQLPQHHAVIRVERPRLGRVVPPPGAGDAGRPAAGRVGEPVHRAAAAHHRPLPAARPDRLRHHRLHRQQPWCALHGAAGARPRLGARRLHGHHPAHLCAVARRRPDQSADPAVPAEGGHLQHHRARPGPVAARGPADRRGPARGPLGAAGQLPPDDVVAGRAGQDDRGLPDAVAARVLPAVAVIVAAPPLPHRHPAARCQDDHGAAKGAQGQHDSADSQHARIQVLAVQQAAKVQEAPVRHVLVPLAAGRPAQIRQPWLEHPVRLQ